MSTNPSGGRKVGILQMSMGWRYELWLVGVSVSNVAEFIRSSLSTGGRIISIAARNVLISTTLVLAVTTTVTQLALVETGKDES